MITKNFKALMALILQSSNNNTGTVPVKGVNGTTYYATNNLAFPKNPSLGFTLSTTAAGVSFGTSGTAATENDYKLGAAITSGLSASVLHTVKMESDGPASTLKFTVTNTSGSSITIREVGYKQTLAVSSSQGYAGTGSVVCLLDRTVLSTPLTIASGDSAILNYKLKTLTDGSSGGGDTPDPGGDTPDPSGGTETPELYITSMPTITTYNELTGYTLDLTGVVVRYKDAYGNYSTVTSACEFTPANGYTLSKPTAGSSRTQQIRVTYAGINATFDVTVTAKADQQDGYVNGVKIVPWSSGADADIAAMIDGARQGKIDLQIDGRWKVGDTRSVTIARYQYSDNTDDYYSAHSVEFVIVSFDQYSNANNVVQIDSKSGPDLGMGGYPFVESEFVTNLLPALYNAIPTYLRSRILEFKYPEYYTGSSYKLGMRSASELLGTYTDSVGNSRGNAASQIDYYKTATKRLKGREAWHNAVITTPANYFTRTPDEGTSDRDFIVIGTDGNTAQSRVYNVGLADPFFFLL